MQCLKIPALGPVGTGGFKAGAIRARHPGRQVPALVLLEGDVRDPASCRSPTCGVLTVLTVLSGCASEDWSREQKGMCHPAYWAAELVS